MFEEYIPVMVGVFVLLVVAVSCILAAIDKLKERESLQRFSLL